MSAKKLLVLAGATAAGKTDLAIRWAKKLKTEIISADSRQFYKELNIGVARPSEEELASVPHHFVAFRSIFEDYNVSSYEQDVLHCLEKLFQDYDTVIMVGGSGMYIDAVCQGLADLPDADPDLRESLKQRLQCEGPDSLRQQLFILDPVYHAEVDLANPVRLIRALEVCIQTGKPYSSFRNQPPKQRPFHIIKTAITRPREELYARINQRVDKMMEENLLQEAKGLYEFRHLNALKTVGYSELFDYFDGSVSLEQAVENIKTHTRRYAKRQETWLKRTNDYIWLQASDNNTLSPPIK